MSDYYAHDERIGLIMDWAESHPYFDTAMVRGAHNWLSTEGEYYTEWGEHCTYERTLSERQNAALDTIMKKFRIYEWHQQAAQRRKHEAAWQAILDEEKKNDPEV